MHQVLSWAQVVVNTSCGPCCEQLPQEEGKEEGREGGNEREREGRQTCKRESKVYQIRPRQLLPTRSLSYSRILPCITWAPAMQQGLISGAAGTPVVLCPAPGCILSTQDKAFQ